MFITSVRESRQETQTCVSALLLSLSADDEDSRSLLSHWRKTLYHHVVHQTVFILFFIPPSSISCCSCIGWNLLWEPLPLHRLSQLTGQLLHRHLKDVKAALNLVSHLFVALQSVAITGFHYFLILAIKTHKCGGEGPPTCSSLKRWSMATPTTMTRKAPSVVTTSTGFMLLHSWKRMMEVDRTTEVKRT